MPKKPSKSTAPKAKNDLEVLKELVALLDSSSATTIKLGRGDVSYEVSRFGGGFAMPMPSAGAAPMPHAPAPAAPTHAPAAPSAPAEKVSNLIEIKSPMVGTFYRAPEPGADPYVKGGSRVAPGQTLCIIEAMKIMNEIQAETKGTVIEVLVENGQPVEYGQRLFKIKLT